MFSRTVTSVALLLYTATLSPSLFCCLDSYTYHHIRHNRHIPCSRSAFFPNRRTTTNIEAPLMPLILVRSHPQPLTVLPLIAKIMSPVSTTEKAGVSTVQRRTPRTCWNKIRAQGQASFQPLQSRNEQKWMGVEYCTHLSRGLWQGLTALLYTHKTAMLRTRTQSESFDQSSVVRGKHTYPLWRDGGRRGAQHPRWRGDHASKPGGMSCFFSR